MKPTRKKWIWFLGFLTAAIILGAVFAWSHHVSLTAAAGTISEATDAAPPRPVKTACVSPRNGTHMREYPGKLRASRRVVLKFEVAGKLRELPAREGMAVSRGDVLARLDAQDYENQLAAARAQSTEARLNLERAQTLFGKKAISKSELDSARAAWEVADATRRIAEKALEDTTLRAPFSGIIARRYVENYTDVTDDTEILSLQDISRLEVVIQVPEQVVARLSDGARLESRLELHAAPDRQFPLELVEQQTEADSETQTYALVLALDAPKGLRILPGMTATVHAVVRTDSDNPAIHVPIDAVVNRSSKTPAVWVVDTAQGTVSQRLVELGPMRGEAIRIQKGLTDGERIVTAGVHYLNEGMRVEPLEGDGESWRR